MENIVCISCAEMTGGAHKNPSMDRLTETVKLYSGGDSQWKLIIDSPLAAEKI